jgi:C-terminal processing protease CtpA/Prc
VGDDGVGQGAADGLATGMGSAFDVGVGIADVIVVWNVLQHFWPYWDVVPADWNAELDVALTDAVDDRSVADHIATIQRLIATAPDDHARTTCGTDRESESTPFTVEVIEDKIAVTSTAAEELVRGDVITSIDRQPAMTHLQADEAMISGSPQWRRYQASGRFGKGRTGSRVTLGILRDGKPLEVVVVRDTTPAAFSHPPIDRLDEGVYYVDLSRATKTEIAAIWDKLAAAPGVVFDMRRYPSSNTEVLSHLLTRPDDSNAWLAVPRVLRPDHTPRSISSWKAEGWKLPVVEPHIAGRVAFLTGPGAVSYGESLMSFVEHYHLGAIVGSATAGTNGNVIEIMAPSGCTTRLSGLRVTKHDGSRHHLVGIQPTIPAARTIAGVAAGRDEVLERGLVYVRSGQ